MTMKVNLFVLPTVGASAATLPRAWRISTDDGVFWLLQDGATSRLLELPPPGELAMRTPPARDTVPARGVALALEAETAAAERWVRRGTV
ncbi:MAG: hypothetical protein U0893_27085 [Chloroflexota bacterium]